MRAALPLALAMLLAAAGCGPKRAKRQAPVPRPVGHTETGIASWYGPPYHGRAAANGEIYDMEKMTAAHRTLPFETWVRVTNLMNDKECEVRITDRGPFIDGRIIDLSKAAARSIDLIGPGIVKVRVQVISAPAPSAGALYAVQVGAFRSRTAADRLRRQMERRFGSARLVERPADPPLWRVLVGQERSLEAAAALSQRIAAEDRTDAAFVVRLDL
jgi:rare lipoprotein A